MTTWRELRPGDGEPYKQVKVIGLHEDVGYSGAWCKDVNLYSSLLLVEDLHDPDKKFLVARPKNLWTSGAFDRCGNFVVSQQAKVNLRACGTSNELINPVCHTIDGSAGGKDTENWKVIDTDALDDSCKQGKLKISFEPFMVPD